VFPKPAECRCRGSADLWAVEALILELNPSVRARKLLATQPQYTIDDDPFIQIELLLASTLSSAHGAKAVQVDQILRDALVTPIDPQRVKDAIDEISVVLAKPIDDQTMIKVGLLINDLISNGAKDAQDSPPPADTPDDSEDNPDDADNEETDDSSPDHTGTILTALLAAGWLARGGSITSAKEISEAFKTMMEGVKYYSSNQLSEVLVPGVDDVITSWIDQLVNDNETENLPPIGGLLESVADEMDMDAYWRTMANATASRAYHYGLFKAGDLLGHSKFIVVNPLDARTSDVCVYLSGMEFDLSAAVDQIESLSDTPFDQIGEVSAFLSPDDIVGRTPEELMAMGVLAPPYHFNCRSWAQFIDDGEDTGSSENDL
jgi:hypothetical protein